MAFSTDSLASSATFGLIMKLRLLFQSKTGGTPKTFEVKLPLVIGRGDKATFRIPHVRVSRRHCELLEENGKVFVRDLGSTNGTILKGTMLPSRTKTQVPPGSLLSVGGLAFRVDYKGPVEDLLPVEEAEAIDFLEAEPEAEPFDSLVELEADDAAEPEAEPLSGAAADDFFLEPDEDLPEAKAEPLESLVELEADDEAKLEAGADDQPAAGPAGDDDDLDDFLKDF